MRAATAQSLDGIGLLRSLSQEERTALATRCRWRKIKQGAFVFERDSANNDIVFLISGKLRAVDLSGGGREIVFAEFEAGSHVGELAAIDGGTRSAAVVAAADSQIASLASTAFRELLSNHHEIAFGLLETIARMVRLADLRITELVTTGAVERICRELLRRSRRIGEAAHGQGYLFIDQLPTQETIAALTGTTRETVGKVMAQLAQARLVERQRRQLKVLDEEGLRAFAGLANEGERL